AGAGLNAVRDLALEIEHELVTDAVGARVVVALRVRRSQPQGSLRLIVGVEAFEEGFGAPLDTRRRRCRRRWRFVVLVEPALLSFSERRWLGVLQKTEQQREMH